MTPVVEPGSVKSALTEFLSHIEWAMLAEAVDPETTQRVLNRVMFGHPAGFPRSVIQPAPDRGEVAHDHPASAVCTLACRAYQP
jgi:hypothetical protein